MVWWELRTSIGLSDARFFILSMELEHRDRAGWHRHLDVLSATMASFFFSLFHCSLLICKHPETGSITWAGPSLRKT